MNALLDKDHILSNSAPFIKRCGIYFLVKDDEIIYIGQSINIPARLAQHVNKHFDRVFVLECSQSELNTVERIYLNHFRPRLNGFRIRKAKQKGVWVNTPMDKDLVRKLDEMVAENGATRSGLIRWLVEKEYSKRKEVK